MFLQEVFVNKVTPQDINGKFFNPHWFSEGYAINVKLEDLETIQEMYTFVSQVTNQPDSGKNDNSTVTSNEELQPRISVESLNIKRTRENGEGGSRNIELDQSLNGESYRVQQSIDTQPPPSKSGSEGEFVFDKKKEKFCTINQATLIRANSKNHTPTSKLDQVKQIRGDVENQPRNSDQQQTSRKEGTPRKQSSSRSASVSSKTKERASIEFSNTEDASIVYEPAVLTRAQKRAIHSKLPHSSFQDGPENSFSFHRQTRKRSLLESQPSHSNDKGVKKSTSTRKNSDQKKFNLKNTVLSTYSGTANSDSDVNPSSSKKKNNRITCSDSSEDEVRVKFISTPAPSEPPSSYATPEQGTINPSGSVQLSKLYTQEKSTAKRRLYEDEDATVPDGRRKLLTDLMVVLHKHSDQLLKKSEEAVQHAEKLNSCLERVRSLKKA